MILRFKIQSAVCVVAILAAGCNPLAGGSAGSLLDENYHPGYDVPQTRSATYLTPKSTAFVGLLEGADGKGDLSFVVQNSPQLGSLSLNASTGVFTYTPLNGISGVDSFTYVVKRAENVSRASTITIVIGNERPTLTSIQNFVGATENSPFLIPYATLLAVSDAIDPEGDTISFLIERVDSGTLTRNGMAVTPGATYLSPGQSLSWTPATEENGLLAAFTVSAFDGVVASLATVTVFVQVTAVNDTPTITAIADATINEDQSHPASFTISDTETALSCSSNHLSATSSNTTLLPVASIVWSGTAPLCTATLSPMANGFGTSTVRVTVNDGALSAHSEFALTVNRLADDYFSAAWPFDAGSAASYIFDPAKLDFTAGVCRLSPTNQTDAASLEFDSGTYLGTNFVADRVELATNGGCSGGGTNCSELDESWAPSWGNLVGYWKLNGNLTGSVGDSLISAYPVPDYTFGAGKILSATTVSGYDGFFYSSDSDVKSSSGLFTAVFWVKAPDTAPGYAGLLTVASDVCCGGLRLDRSGASPTLRVRVDTSAGTNHGVVGTASSVFDDQWHQVAVSLSGNRIKLYVDGKLEGDNTFALGTGISAGSFFFGRRHDIGQHFVGSLDDIAVWNTALSDAEVALIYARQSPLYSGTFTSRVMNGGSDTATWSSLSWKTNLPLGKSLPSNANEEEASVYPDLVGSTGQAGDDNLMSGIVGLWRFEESSITAGPNNDFTDASGNAKHAESVGGTTPGRTGRIGKGVQLDGVNGYVATGTNLGPLFIDETVTISVWFLANAHGVIVYELADGGWNDTQIELLSSGDLRVRVWNLPSVSLGTAALGKWHHAVLRYNKSTLRLDGFLNGIKSSSFITGDRDAPWESALGGLWYAFGLGGVQNLGSGAYLNGLIDEAAIWNRALHDTEIKQLYLRGANQAKFQVRVCALAGCADNPEWKGPNGTRSTYFSELNNNSAASTTLGNVLATAPSLNFTDFPSLNLGTGRYFQYRTILESFATDVSMLNDRPKLREVVVGPIHYEDTGPSVVGSVGPSFFSLTQLTPQFGAGGCAGGLRFQLSKDKITWYRWNGAVWASAANAFTDASDLATINANIASFGTQLGAGTVFVRSFLKSDGTSACELDNLTLEGFE